MKSPANTPSTVFPQAQHFVSKFHNTHNYFDGSLPPVLSVQPGELIHVETYDCFHGAVQSSHADPNQVLAAIPREQLNPVTGPIFVHGAEPGDWLAVQLLDIRPEGEGVACCSTHSGQLCHWMTEEITTKFFQVKGDTVIMKEDTAASRRIAPIGFPKRPMLGVIGVAPKGDPILTMPAGKHGGNMDNNCHGIGATIYIPVQHPGALLSVGDMHASQGDGEISGTGVEIGGHVLLKCGILKKESLLPLSSSNNNDIPQSLPEFPVTETATHWITHGVLEENIPQTTNIACQEAACLLVRQWGFTKEEAFVFLSTAANLGLCQSCHPDQGTQIAKMVVPKIDACPRPFRVLWEQEQEEKQQQ
ncbi:Acetamidase formamidase [Seminavis robusta]|uniref:Acetamidase formamidase n=1 Tax=Seminavis robusta TaxID=568900 RepID=A0A9N8EZN0_9STRA|nr:Acetamidase formamidase [Seminavis robusta]|eukprot:Sro2630_g333120.1 Acetamidase formamidase (361) ;mRNA; f:7711-8793